MNIYDLNLWLPSTLAFALHWVVIAALAVRVLMKRPMVGVALAWLSVIVTLPLVGAVLYLLVGERRIGRDRMARIAEQDELIQEWHKALTNRVVSDVDDPNDSTDPIRRHARNLLGYPAQGGNRIELISGRDPSFDAIIADIKSAQFTCEAVFYIWEDAGRALEVAEALIEASARGVRCRAMADAIGSRAFLRSKHADRLRQSGVELIESLPTGAIRTLFVRRDHRNHRKIIVVDSRVAYIGSQNMVDPRFFKQRSGVGEWVDAVARVTGTSACTIAGVFELDWAVEQSSTCVLPVDSQNEESDKGNAVIQVFPSGPDHHPGSIHQVLLTAIYSAQEELVLTTPYFVPDDSLQTALVSAALRGVDVSLVIPSRVDSILARYASVSNFSDLMCAGVKLYRFEGGLLHTKSITIDGTASVFGSVNLDMRSFWLNFEISLFVYDKEFTSSLRELQESYIMDSVRYDLDAWEARPFTRKFLENAARLVGPLL